MSRARQKRVVLLHFTTPSLLGGVEQVLAVHALALRAAGARVTIVAGRGRLTPALARAGVKLVRIPEVDSKHPQVLRAAAALARGEIPPLYGELSLRIERALRPVVEAADRVVAHNVLTLHKNHALARALERLAETRPGRFIHWTHDLGWTDVQYAGELHAGEPWDRFRRRIPNVRYVAVSPERAAELRTLLRVRQSDVGVVVNGVSLPALLGLSTAGAALAERLSLYEADPLLLLPARLTRRKRIEAAIEAAKVLRRDGANAHLVVTGAPGAHNLGNRRYLAELRARAEGAEGVHLLYALGIRPSYRVIADLYALADVLVLPTGNEGFGIPIIEAGMRRLPIVCTDLPALRGLAGDDATYVPADADGAAIARAITRRLAADPEARLRSRARKYAWPQVLAERVLPVILEDAP